VQLDLGAERVVFLKPDKLGQHMKPLYIKGYLDGEPINHMLVDGGACVNIMPHSMFEKMGHCKSELMKMNMMLNGFSGEVSDAKRIISTELMIGSKTVLTAFSLVDVMGKYNMLGRDWIHSNGCVPSTLHQCVVQWVGNNVEILEVDDSMCVVLTELQGDGGFVPVNVMPMVVNRLEDIGVKKMMDKEKCIAWLLERMVEYRAKKDGISELVEDFEDVGSLGQGFSAMDELQEVNLGEGNVLKPTYISANLPQEQRTNV
jgi:hypothetical protein